MLTSEIIAVDCVEHEDRLRMLSLMQMYYENVDADQFYKDLARKDCVIVLRESGVIQGFSTQRLLTNNICGQEVRLLFSGDTVIDQHHRDSLSLPIAWGRMMLDILSRFPVTPLYWLLISKGYRTYRYLPVFFKDYFPCTDRCLSGLEQGILETFTDDLFNGQLDRDSWILRSSGNSQRVRPGVTDITEAKRRKADIAFFEALNPGHASGDELICLAKFEEDNLHPFILRRLLSK